MILYLFQETVYLVPIFNGCVEPELDRGGEFHLKAFTQGGTEERLCVIQDRKRQFAVFFLEDANEHSGKFEVIGHVHPCDSNEAYSRVFQTAHDDVCNLLADEVTHSL